MLYFVIGVALVGWCLYVDRALLLKDVKAEIPAVEAEILKLDAAAKKDLVVAWNFLKSRF